MKRFLVIGASGYVGKSIADKANSKDPLTLTHCNSIQNIDSIKFDFFNDDISNKIPIDHIATVIFAAMVEDQADSDVKEPMYRLANVFSNARMIYISSDAVFSGKKGNYTDSDIPDATIVYGKNLTQCETIIRDTCPNHCIIRPSYLYGFSSGKLDKRLSATKSDLLKGRKVSLFRNMYKSPLGVQQFAEAVMVLALSDFVGTIHVAGHRTSVYDFHHDAMKALGVDTSNLRPIKIPENSELPKDTSLDISKWQKLSRIIPLSIGETLGKGLKPM